MKRIILSLVAVLLATGMFAIDITQQRKDLMTMLKRTSGVTAAAPNKENNNIVDLNFKKEYYQIALEDFNGFLKITFSTPGYKLKPGNYEKRAVYEVTTSVNQNYHSVKVKIESNRIGFEQQMFVKDITAFSPTVLRQYLEILDKAKEEFTNNYKIKNNKYARERRDREINDSIRREDSIRNAKIQSGDSVIIVEPEKPSQLQMTAAVEVYNVDGHGNKNNVDGKDLRVGKTQYIAFVLKTKSPVKKEYNIRVRIFNPDGVPILTEKDSKYTFEFPISAQKNKENETTTEAFGSMSQNIWTAGTYKVEFYEGDAKLTTTTFTIEK